MAKYVGLNIIVDGNNHVIASWATRRDEGVREGDGVTLNTGPLDDARLQEMAYRLLSLPTAGG